MILKKCPICGKKLTESKINYSITVGSSTEEDLVTSVKCGNCGFCTSDFEENESVKADVLKKAQSACVVAAIESLKDKYSLSEIEMAMGLPLRTLSKYKNQTKNPSASAVALLQLLQTFPWLVVVAEEKFNQDSAYEIAEIALEKRNPAKRTRKVIPENSFQYDSTYRSINYPSTNFSKKKTKKTGMTYEQECTCAY